MTFTAKSPLSFLFLLLIHFQASNSWAEQNYIIGTEAIEYYPHHGKNYPDSTDFSGYAREVIDAFFISKNLSFEYTPLSIKRLYRSFFLDRSIDFKYPDSSEWKKHIRKNKKIYYSGPIGYYTDGVFVNRKNLPADISEIKKLGTMRGFTPLPFIEIIDNGDIQLFEFSKTDDLLTALLAKQIDGAYLNIDVARYKVDLLFGGDNSPLFFDNSLPFIEGHYQLSSMKHPNIINKLTDFLNNNQQLITDIANKYKVKRPPTKRPH